MDYTPTPPTVIESPIVVIYIPNLSTDSFKLYGGEFRGVPSLWRIVDLYVKAVCSADAGNRAIRVYKYRPGNLKYWAFQSGTLIANDTKELMFNGIHPTMTNASSLMWAQVNYTQPLYLQGDEWLNIYLGSAKAADSWDGQITVQYMNRIFGMPTPYDARQKGG